MGRDKAKRGGHRNGDGPRPQNQLQAARMFPGTPEEFDRQRQDFLAGSVFAAGAGVALPTGGPGVPPSMLSSMFTVYLADDEATWGPAPQLARLFELLDEHGAVALHEMCTIGTAWSGLDHPDDPLAKLKLDIHQPEAAKGKCEILLLAANYADAWQHIVGGGMIGLTTFERMAAKTDRPGATMADGLEACILLGIGSSPVLEMLIRNHGWPGV